LRPEIDPVQEVATLVALNAGGHGPVTGVAPDADMAETEIRA
jgi:hypothetical protein